METAAKKEAVTRGTLLGRFQASRMSSKWERRPREKPLAKLGARKIATQEVAVIFDREQRVPFSGCSPICVLGGAIWRKASYLVGREGSGIASHLVTVIDDL